MAIIAKDNGENYESIPLETQQAVCAFVEDIGTQEGYYMGSSIIKHQVVICWELAEKMTTGEHAGKPFMISKFYTLSLNEKANLCKDLESWRGKPFTAEERKGFDIEKLIGANCLLNIIEDERTDGKKYPKVASVSPILKNMPKIVPVNKVPPDWIQKKREQSIEWKEAKEGYATNNEADEGLPF